MARIIVSASKASKKPHRKRTYTQLCKSGSEPLCHQNLPEPFPHPERENPLRNTVSPLPWIDDMDHRTLSVTEHLKARGVSRGIKCIESLGVTTVFAGRTSTRGEQHNTQKQTNNRRSAHKITTEHDVFGTELFRRLIIVNQIINSQH